MEIKGVMVGVLTILGLALQQVPVEGVKCSESFCYSQCFNGTLDSTLCAKSCGCTIRNSAGETIAVEYCNLGCRSFLCDKMSTASGGSKKMDMEQCVDGCYGFCKGDAVISSIAA